MREFLNSPPSKTTSAVLWVILATAFIYWMYSLPVGEISERGELDAVYFHEKNRYSGMVVENGVVRTVTLPTYHELDYTVFTDVKPGERSWYEYRYLWSELSGVREGYLHIHIRAVDQIGTACWDHGKLGNGCTQRIN